MIAILPWLARRRPAPTSTVGMVLPNGSELDYFGELSALQFIVESAAPILDIAYYV